jgi:hypothetical protein
MNGYKLYKWMDDVNVSLFYTSMNRSSHVGLNDVLTWILLLKQEGHQGTWSSIGGGHVVRGVGRPRFPAFLFSCCRLSLIWIDG